MCRDARRIRQALNITRLSKHRFPIAALIYQGSTPISVGVNKYKSHPQQINPFTHQHGTSIHAELDSILGINPDELDGAVIYIARKLRNGSSGLARPCPSCLKVIEAVGIQRIVYTTYSGFKSENIGEKNERAT